MRVRGHALSYETAGEGPPVVLVHGLGGSVRWWRATADQLAHTHRVIVPQLPGFGYGLGGGGFGLADAAPVLGRLLERLDLGPAALVGHSYGALATLAVAVAEPVAVSRLVMLAPPVAPASTRLLGNAVPALRTILGLSPPDALAVAGSIAWRSPAALLRAAGELLALDGPGAEPAVPTMVLWGDRDALVPLGGAGWVAREMPAARLRIIPGAGHMLMLDRPDALVAELRAFLDPAAR